MAYDENNNKTNEILFLNGQPYATNRFIYDANNLLRISYDPLGHSNVFNYNSFGQPTEILSVCSRGCLCGTTNFYDGKGNLVGTSDALGNTTTNFYNERCLLVGSRDAIGTVTTNYYDDSGNLIATATHAADGVTILSTNSFAYDANGNQIESVTRRRNRSTGIWLGATNFYIYDAQNRLIHTIGPDGGTNSIVYNAIGKQEATIDQLGRITRYYYDAQGRLYKTVYPDNTYELSYYDAEGRRTNSVDRAGRSTRYVYDALGRLTHTIYPDFTTNTTVYDDLGRVRFTIDPRGITNAFGYDRAGQRIAVTNAFGTPVQAVYGYGYDERGNQIYFTNALGRVTTNVYDALNRLVEVWYPDGTKTLTGYDGAGRRVAESNQDNIVTLFGYDGIGRLVAVTNALGTAQQMITRYEYDEAGNLIAHIDALNRTNRFEYNLVNRRVKRTLPGGQYEMFAYDLVGNLIRHTNFNGVVITNEYDVMNRLTNRSSVDGYRVSYTYTPTGQRQTMTDPSGVTFYRYDERDRLTNKVVRFAGGPQLELHYRFDAAGNLTNMWSDTPGGVSNIYRYDWLNRLTNVLANGALAASYSFDADGNLRSIRYGNGVTNLYEYDRLNRLTNLVWKLNTTALASFTYRLGATGNRTNLSEVVNGVSRNYAWSYDWLYRLTNEVISGTAPAGSLGYRYDPVGNRTNRSSTLGALTNQNFAFTVNDWLVGDTYDANGNTIGSGGNTYQYDVEDRLISAVVNGVSVECGYNGDGVRVKKTVGTTNIYYLVDDRNPSGYAQVLEEHESVNRGATTVSRVYNYGLDLISQREVGGTVYYFIYDGHGTTRLLTTTNGGVANAFAYDAWGTLIASNGLPQTVYLYTGEQFDPHLGFYYLRARYLNTGTGRFWTRDSWEGNQSDPISLHKYLYCHADPVNGTDPSGLFLLVDFQLRSSIEIGGRSHMLPQQVRAYQTAVSIREWNTAVAALQGSVAGSAVYKGAAITVAGMIIAGHLAMIWEALDPEAHEWAQARQVLKTSVETAAREKGCSGRILYYYNGVARIAACWSASALFASKGAPKDGFPVGAYASDIPPWDCTYTQTELAQGFYGVDQGWRDVGYFIAFCDDGTWNPLPNTLNPGILHWHKYARKEGDLVPIRRICVGVNSMP